MAIERIDQARLDGSRLEPACQVVGICRRTYSRWKKQSQLKCFVDKRTLERSPKIALMRRLSAEEEARVLEVCNEARFASLPPGQIVPTLADEGVYLCSESTMYRILRKHSQINRRGRAQKREKVSKPKEIKVTAPEQCYCWDITYLPTLIVGAFFKLYCVMDLFSRKIVGWEIHETESSDHAKVLLNKVRLREHIDTRSLTIHSDNGPPMKGQTLVSFLSSLGVAMSYSRPGVSDDNPFAESLFKTVKYCRHYPEKPFETIEAARQWMLSFANWYNSEHLHSELKFVTPQQKHKQQDIEILGKRDLLYQQARDRHPIRWSRQTRDWTPVYYTMLNPDDPLSPGRRSVVSRSGQSELSRAQNAA